MPDSHFEPHSQLNNDFISAISSLGKAYYGAPYNNMYRFALPARLPNSFVKGRPSDTMKFAPKSLEGLVLEGSMTRLGDALYDWMHLVNQLYGFPGQTWPCLYPTQEVEPCINEKSLDMKI